MSTSAWCYLHNGRLGSAGERCLCGRAESNAVTVPADKLAELQRDARRLDWIAQQGDEFSSGILQDCPGDGDYYVSGAGDSYGTGKTFRDAIDNARGSGAGTEKNDG